MKLDTEDVVHKKRSAFSSEAFIKAKHGFISSDLGCMHYLLSRAILQVGSMLIPVGQTGYVHIVVKGSLADEMHADPLLKSLRQWYAALLTPETDTMSFFFGQPNHMQVSCLDFLNN